MKEITAGLQALYSLGLEGAPGGDVIPATARVWAFDLWLSRKRFWVENDIQDIRTAFSLMRSSCNRWPPQPKFWESLPQRKSKTSAKMAPEDGREREQEALEGMRRQFREYGLDQWGYPLK